MQEQVVRGTGVKKVKVRGVRKKNEPKPKKMLINSKVSDSSGKVIFEEPILCAQFVRDYVDLPYMKDVQPEYNIFMQIFRYMVYIWEDYEKKEEKKHKGISKTKNFRYPPILPIVYYEGSQKWTAPLHFGDRVAYGDVFEKYVPDFQYYLVPIRNYTNEELLKKADEISLVMLFDKLQNEADVAQLRELIRAIFIKNE